MTSPNIAGWYGKIASLGDFASRRLPNAFITLWDGWLQKVMTDSRTRLGEGWLNAYLTCPVWRFVLFPGLCGDKAWAGVMMPSVDKVGRYFPVTISCELHPFVSTEHEFNALADWMDRLESLALSTLSITQDAQHFDTALMALHAPVVAAPRVALARKLVATLRNHECSEFPLESDDELAQTLMGAGATLLHETIHAASLWWTPGEPGASARLVACHGLPDGRHFTAMLQATATRPA